MLATLVDRPFDRAGWVFEVKWDGYRVVAEIDGTEVLLHSRNLKTLNHRFPPVARALAGMGPLRAVLDGEVVVLDRAGRADFQSLQNYMRTGAGDLVYYVFDILHYDGYDMMPLPLLRRKTILRRILPDRTGVRFSDHIEEQGIEFFRAIAKEGVEGMMAKDGAGVYEAGKRTTSWLKVKAGSRQEAVIAGFTEPRNSRKAFGALILGAYDGRKLAYIGHVGTGFTQAGLASLKALLLPLVTDRPPFGEVPRTNTPVTWVKPEMVCEVRFSEWTDEGVMRQPVFLGLRDDKNPRDVRREKAAVS
jgi:bifunctional non-homologous end joining protein LigD